MRNAPRPPATRSVWVCVVRSRRLKRKRAPAGTSLIPRRDATVERARPLADQLLAGEFYCVKCKAKREATGEVKVSEKGTRMAKGVCPECNTNLNRILGKA